MDRDTTEELSMLDMDNNDRVLIDNVDSIHQHSIVVSLHWITHLRTVMLSQKRALLLALEINKKRY